jgi:hypothetical protein
LYLGFARGRVTRLFPFLMYLKTEEEVTGFVKLKEPVMRDA